MPRRYRRRYARASRPLKTVKYSNETYNSGGNQNYFYTGQQNQAQIATTIIDSINSQGMRKVKNISLNIMTGSQIPLVWALVYVPQGGTPGNLNIGAPNAAASLYEPNQNVIMSGTVVAGCAQQTWRTRLARNLNSGDSIVFTWKQLTLLDEGQDTGTVANPKNYPLFISANYAITY